MFNKIKAVFLIVLGVISFIYYGVCIAFAWIGVSWLWIWPLLGIFCFVRAFMLLKKFRFPKWVKIVYHTLVIICLAVFIFVESEIIVAMTTPEKSDLDYIITLGAAVRGGKPTSPLLLRIDKTIEYMNENPDTILIASGGFGEGETLSEAQCISNYVQEAGIDKNRIIIEDRSTSTEENIANSFKYIPEGSEVGLVSSSFHLFRAMKIASFQGYEVSGVPAVTYPILGVHYVVREFFGVIEADMKYLLA